MTNRKKEILYGVIPVIILYVMIELLLYGVNWLLGGEHQAFHNAIASTALFLSVSAILNTKP